MTSITTLKNSEIATYKSIDEDSSKSIYDNPIFKPRLYQAKIHFYEQYKTSGFIDLNELESCYLDWVNFDEFYTIKKKIYGIGVYVLTGKVVKSSKRGNDVYNSRVSKKFNLIYKALENYEAEYDNAYVLRTDILFFTLTYANRDLYEVYENSGKDYNRFMSNLRKIFPKAKTIARCFEAQRDGTVHIHALIYIGTHIDITPWINQKGKKVYIIKNYDLWLKLKNCWKYGFSDIQGFVKFRDGLKYIFKYIKKGINVDSDDSSLITLSLNWLFEKRSFSINYDVLRILFNLRFNISPHKSNSRTILRCIGLIIEYEFVGVFSKKQLNLKDDKWFYEFYEFPEELINLIWGKWETPFR
jgi:hypothetical protein